jgi:hypothetical protein
VSHANAFLCAAVAVLVASAPGAAADLGQAIKLKGK